MQVQKLNVFLKQCTDVHQHTLTAPRTNPLQTKNTSIGLTPFSMQSDISNTSLHKGDLKNMHTMCEKCQFCQYYVQVKNNVSGLIRVMSFDGSPLAQFSMQVLDHF